MTKKSQTHQPAGSTTHQGALPLGNLLQGYQLQDKGGYITQEFQDYAYRLAVALDDLPHKSVYMKMAKTVDRRILDQALGFVSDSQAKSKAKLFMWKVKQLRTELADKQPTAVGK